MSVHCRQRGVLLMEAFMWRHQPRTEGIRKLLGEGVIGELRLVRSSFSFPIGPGDWRLDPSRGPSPDGSILLVRHRERLVGLVVDTVAGELQGVLNQISAAMA